MSQFVSIAKANATIGLVFLVLIATSGVIDAQGAPFILRDQTLFTGGNIEDKGQVLIQNVNIITQRLIYFDIVSPTATVTTKSVVVENLNLGAGIFRLRLLKLENGANVMINQLHNCSRLIFDNVVSSFTASIEVKNASCEQFHAVGSQFFMSTVLFLHDSEFLQPVTATPAWLLYSTKFYNSSAIKIQNCKFIHTAHPSLGYQTIMSAGVGTAFLDEGTFIWGKGNLVYGPNKTVDFAIRVSDFQVDFSTELKGELMVWGGYVGLHIRYHAKSAPLTIENWVVSRMFIHVVIFEEKVNIPPISILNVSQDVLTGGPQAPFLLDVDQGVAGISEEGPRAEIRPLPAYQHLPLLHINSFRYVGEDGLVWKVSSLLELHHAIVDIENLGGRYHEFVIPSVNDSSQLRLLNHSDAKDTRIQIAGLKMDGSSLVNIENCWLRSFVCRISHFSHGSTFQVHASNFKRFEFYRVTFDNSTFLMKNLQTKRNYFPAEETIYIDAQFQNQSTMRWINCHYYLEQFLDEMGTSPLVMWAFTLRVMNQSRIFVMDSSFIAEFPEDALNTTQHTSFSLIRGLSSAFYDTSQFFFENVTLKAGLKEGAVMSATTANKYWALRLERYAAIGHKPIVWPVVVRRGFYVHYGRIAMDPLHPALSSFTAPIRLSESLFLYFAHGSYATATGNHKFLIKDWEFRHTPPQESHLWLLMEHTSTANDEYGLKNIDFEVEGLLVDIIKVEVKMFNASIAFRKITDLAAIRVDESHLWHSTLLMEDLSIMRGLASLRIQGWFQQETMIRVERCAVEYFHFSASELLDNSRLSIVSTVGQSSELRSNTINQSIVEVLGTKGQLRMVNNELLNSSVVAQENLFQHTLKDHLVLIDACSFNHSTFCLRNNSFVAPPGLHLKYDNFYAAGMIIMRSIFDISSKVKLFDNFFDVDGEYDNITSNALDVRDNTGGGDFLQLFGTHHFNGSVRIVLGTNNDNPKRNILLANFVVFGALNLDFGGSKSGDWGFSQFHLHHFSVRGKANIFLPYCSRGCHFLLEDTVFNFTVDLYSNMELGYHASHIEVRNTVAVEKSFSFQKSVWKSGTQVYIHDCQLYHMRMQFRETIGVFVWIEKMKISRSFSIYGDDSQLISPFHLASSRVECRNVQIVPDRTEVSYLDLHQSNIIFVNFSRIGEFLMPSNNVDNSSTINLTDVNIITSDLGHGWGFGLFRTVLRGNSRIWFKRVQIEAPYALRIVKDNIFQENEGWIVLENVIINATVAIDSEIYIGLLTKGIVRISGHVELKLHFSNQSIQHSNIFVSRNVHVASHLQQRFSITFYLFNASYSLKDCTMDSRLALLLSPSNDPFRGNLTTDSVIVVHSVHMISTHIERTTFRHSQILFLSSIMKKDFICSNSNFSSGSLIAIKNCSVESILLTDLWLTEQMTIQFSENNVSLVTRMRSLNLLDSFIELRNNVFWNHALGLNRLSFSTNSAIVVSQNLLFSSAVDDNTHLICLEDFVILRNDSHVCISDNVFQRRPAGGATITSASREVYVVGTCFFDGSSSFRLINNSFSAPLGRSNAILSITPIVSDGVFEIAFNNIPGLMDLSLNISTAYLISNTFSEPPSMILSPPDTAYTHTSACNTIGSAATPLPEPKSFQTIQCQANTLYARCPGDLTSMASVKNPLTFKKCFPCSSTKPSVDWKEPSFILEDASDDVSELIDLPLAFPSLRGFTQDQAVCRATWPDTGTVSQSLLKTASLTLMKTTSPSRTVPHLSCQSATSTPSQSVHRHQEDEQTVTKSIHKRINNISITVIADDMEPKSETLSLNQRTATVTLQPPTTPMAPTSNRPTVAPTTPEPTTPLPTPAPAKPSSSRALASVIPQTAAENVATAGTAAVSVSALASPTTAAQANKVGAVIQAMNCAFDELDERPSKMEHPFQIAMTEDPLRHFVGSCLLSMLLLLIVCIVQLVIFCYSAEKHREYFARFAPQTPPKEAAEFDNKPLHLKLLLKLQSGVAILAALIIAYFVPNIVGTVTTILLHASDQAAVGLGGLVAVVTSFVVGCEVMVLTKYFSAVAKLKKEEDQGKKKAKVDEDSSYKKHNAFSSGLMARISFENTNMEIPYVEALGPFFDASKDGDRMMIRLYYVEDIGVASMIALVSGLRPISGSCSAIVGIVALISVLHFFYLIYYRPYRTKLDTVFCTFFALNQVVLGLCAYVAISNPAALKFVGYAVLLQMASFFAQTIAQTCWGIALLYRRWRQDKQKEKQQKAGKQQSNSIDENEMELKEMQSPFLDLRPSTPNFIQKGQKRQVGADEEDDDVTSLLQSIDGMDRHHPSALLYVPSSDENKDLLFASPFSQQNTSGAISLNTSSHETLGLNPLSPTRMKPSMKEKRKRPEF